MNGLNNVYGQSNGCPPIMGRTSITNNHGSQYIIEDLKKKYKSDTTNEFRKKIQMVDTTNLYEIQNKAENLFKCMSEPKGDIKIKPLDINDLSNYTSEISWQTQFNKLLD